jgi:hypothetical protein
VVAAAPADRVAFLVAEVLRHLRLERALQHGAGDLAEQATRPDQRHTLCPGLVDQLLRDPHVQARGRAVASRRFLGSGVLVRQW